MIRMMTFSVIILAVHHPGFLRMQFQMALCKPLLQRRQQLLRLYGLLCPGASLRFSDSCGISA